MLERSLTLLQLFLLASAAILVVGAVILGWVLTRAIHSEALDSEKASLARYADSVVRPAVVRGNRVVLTRSGDAALLRTLHAQPEVVTVKVWRPDGTLAWTNRERSRIGRRFPLDSELGEAIRENHPVADIVGTGGEGENAVEQRLGFSHLFQVYAPIESTDRSHAIGAYEIYADPAGVEQLISSRRNMIWGAVAGIFLVLYGALTLLVRGASRTLRRQNDTLRERSERLLDSYRRLEESALEAVESLNAAVDAKDPYTAGHSQRVQRVALAIGAELGLDATALDALRFAGLFHDIGKLRVPDAILTKPDGADAGGVRHHQAPSRGRRGDRRPARTAARRRAVDPASPRALGRQRLSRRACRRRDSARGVDRRARRRVGRDDERPSVQPRPHDRRSGEGDPRRARHPVRARGRGRVLRCAAARAVDVRRRRAARGEHRLVDSEAVAEKLQGGRLAARAVAAHGVDAVFTLSGGHVMPVYEGCRHEGVRVVDVRHEQAAAHAAEAWGRMRRACGVAVVTAGPGVTGTLTAVANCFAAQTPLVVIGGARPLVQAGQGALQELDQLSLFKPITKWAEICGDAERIPDFVATAFRHALAPPRGPVYLELPMDVLFADADDPGDARARRAPTRARSATRTRSRAPPISCRAPSGPR